MKYFIMINTRNGRPLPMTDDNDEIVLFENHKEAYKAVCNNTLCKACGFIIYKWDESKAAANE